MISIKFQKTVTVSVQGILLKSTSLQTAKLGVGKLRPAG